MPLASERQERRVPGVGYVCSRIIDPVNGRNHWGMALECGDQRNLESPGQIDKSGNIQVVVREIRAISCEEVVQILRNIPDALAVLQSIRGGELETASEAFVHLYQQCLVLRTCSGSPEADAAVGACSGRVA